MESKAQKAALAHVEKMIEDLIASIPKTVQHGFERYYGDYGDHILSSEDIESDLNNLSETINEYGLKDEVLTKAVEKVYDALMKDKRYDIAASLAIKYGL